MNYDSTFNQKVHIIFQASSYRPILTIWKISKENTYNSENFAFICSEIIVSSNFIPEKCMACYISMKKMSALFLF